MGGVEERNVASQFDERKNEKKNEEEFRIINNYHFAEPLCVWVISNITGTGYSGEQGGSTGEFSLYLLRYLVDNLDIGGFNFYIGKRKPSFQV